MIIKIEDIRLIDENARHEKINFKIEDTMMTGFHVLIMFQFHFYVSF